MTLASLQSTMNGKARTAGEFFKSAAEANAHAMDLKRAGAGNVRVARYHDHTRDGVKVYRWVVRCNADGSS